MSAPLADSILQLCIACLGGDILQHLQHRVVDGPTVLHLVDVDVLQIGGVDMLGLLGLPKRNAPIRCELFGTLVGSRAKVHAATVD